MPIPTKAELDRKHPRYEAMLEDWQLYRDSYTGRGGFRGDYLVRHPREGRSGGANDKFELRKKYSRYPNLIMPTVNKYLGALFREAATRDGTPEYIDWLKICGGTREGMRLGIEEVMSEHTWTYMIYGEAQLVLDSPREVPEGGSRAEVNDSIYPPYLTNYTPIDTYDKSVTGNGVLSGAKYHAVQHSSEIWGGEVREEHWYYVWGWTEGAVYRAYKEKGADGKDEWRIEPIVERAEHGYIGGPPIISSRLVFGDTSSVAVPFLDGMSQMAVELYNMTSERRSYYRDQMAFPVLIMPVRDPSEQKGFLMNPGDDTIYFREEAKHKPEMLRGDVSALTQYREDIAELVQMMYSLAVQRVRNTTGSARSGESYRQEFADTQSLLSIMAGINEQVEERIFELWKQATNNPGADYSVKYPRNFDIDSATDQLDDLLTIANSDLSPLMTEEAKMQINRKNLTANNLKRQAEIDADIKAMNTDNLPRTGSNSEFTGDEQNADNRNSDAAAART